MTIFCKIGKFWKYKIKLHIGHSKIPRDQLSFKPSTSSNSLKDCNSEWTVFPEKLNLTLQIVWHITKMSKDV